MSHSKPKGLAAYIAVTAAYWAFMLTDGALRMLVLLHFNMLGFTPVQLAYLFILYEVAGIVTNLSAGWIAARYGLTSTLYMGLSIQIIALLALTQLDPTWTVAVSVAFVMGVQGLSGVAKDLAKTSSKSAVKLLAPEQGGGLFKWVAILTGSKNAVKGVGFFLGAALLASFGFETALLGMAGILTLILVAVLLGMPPGLPVGKKGAKFSQVFSTDPRINWLSGARLFLFGARDVWFVVGIPIYFTAQLSDGTPAGNQQAFFLVGGFMAAWIIGYGFVQGTAPRWLGGADQPLHRRAPQARRWAWALVVVQAALALATVILSGLPLSLTLVVGLLIFGAIFAVNSALHSFLILAFSKSERVSMDVGFYYMANAGGRLFGTLFSGLSYQLGGITACLAVSAIMAVGSTLILRGLKPEEGLEKTTA